MYLQRNDDDGEEGKGEGGYVLLTFRTALVDCVVGGSASACGGSCEILQVMCDCDTRTEIEGGTR